jgi:hypothetical protein
MLGNNWMSVTSFFYGFYDGTYVFEYGNVTIDFPLAYFLVMLSGARFTNF